MGIHLLGGKAGLDSAKLELDVIGSLSCPLWKQWSLFCLFLIVCGGFCRPEGDVESSGTGILNGCDLLCGH